MVQQQWPCCASNDVVSPAAVGPLTRRRRRCDDDGDGGSGAPNRIRLP